MAAHSKERKQVMRVLTKMRQLAKGLQENGQLLANLQLLGQIVTPAQALAGLQKSLSAGDLVDSNKKALTANLAVRDAAVLADQPYLRTLSAALYSHLGSRNVELSRFGLPYDKPRKKRTAAEEAISAGLRRQTRAVRGTMGPKQRAAITAAGTPGVIVVDPTGKPIPGTGRAPVAPGKRPQK